MIKWGDAFIDSDDFDIEEAQDTGPILRWTVGFLIAKNKHGYVLSTDVFDDKEASALMFIPHGMVLAIKLMT